MVPGDEMAAGRRAFGLSAAERPKGPTQDAVHAKEPGYWPMLDPLGQRVWDILERGKRRREARPNTLSP